MQPTPAAIGLSFVMLLGLAVCGGGWLIAAARVAVSLGWVGSVGEQTLAALLQPWGIAPRLPLVAWSPRRTVPWAVVDLVGLLGVWLIVKLMLELTCVKFGWIPHGVELAKLSLAQQQTFVLLSIAESLLGLAIGLPLVALRTGARLRDFGWSPREILSDLKLGLIGLAMLAPPVYALQALLVYFWQPSEHPFIEMFKQSPDSGFFAVLFVAAAIVAPLYEELMFRVLAQGFLERAFTHTGSLRELLWDSPRPAAPPPADAIVPVDPIAADAIPMAWSDPGNPYLAPQPVDEAPPKPPLAEAQQPAEVEQPELRGPPAWCSIGVSAAVFALLHWDHGPDWIPLLLLASGMGYLYQRTHRLVPSLVVHCGLNGITMWILWVGIFEQSAAG